MTIKTLELLVGIPRASIRFYEDQGLLAPARLENGYRDYSEADAQTLRKIKLLRSLQLDLAAIGRLQRGELTLDQALTDQLAGLEADQAALDRARQVCSELKEAGTDWFTLDPRPWLEKLAAAPVPASPRYAPPVDLAPPPDSVLYPWRRFLAREIDLILCGVLWGALSLLLLRWYPPVTQPALLFYNLFHGYVIWALVFLLEPLLLHRFGTTPGKAVFGISVHDGEGNRLSWKAALRRTWTVFSRGCGWGLPFYSQWRLWKSYQSCRDEQRGDWEGYLRRDRTFVWERYRVADDRGWRGVACALVLLLSAAAAVFITACSYLPPNRGALTEAGFYDNCNFYIDRLGVGGRRLDGEGRLLAPAETPGTVAIRLGDEIETAFSVTLDSGTVTGVKLIRQAETDSTLWAFDPYQQVAFLAFAGSLTEVGPFTFLRAATGMSKFLETAGHDYTIPGERICAGLPPLRVRQVTRLENFKNTSSLHFFLEPEEGRTARFWLEFTVAPER